MILRYWSITLVCTLFMFALPAASGAMTIDAEQQYRFAEALFDSHQYRRAAEEYQRFAFFFPDDPRQRRSSFMAGQAFLLAKDPETALNLFNRLSDHMPLDSVAIESYFMMVECHLQLHAVTQAVMDLNNLIILSDDRSVRNRAYNRLGWLYIDQTDWAAAQTAFARISADQRSRYRVDDLERDLNDSSRLPARSPALAGALSIIPGGGQLYCNRYEDALIAFAVNTGLIWAAHDAFDKEQYGLGGLLSFVAVGFYAGNIYSAVADAHKYNQLQKQKFRDDLKRNLVTGRSTGEFTFRPRVLLSLQVPF